MSEHESDKSLYVVGLPGSMFALSLFHRMQRASQQGCWAQPNSSATSSVSLKLFLNHFLPVRPAPVFPCLHSFSVYSMYTCQGKGCWILIHSGWVFTTSGEINTPPLYLVNRAFLWAQTVTIKAINSAAKSVDLLISTKWKYLFFRHF